jgi:hypothetical protein
MKRFWLVPLAMSAVAVGLSVSSAQAAPATTIFDVLKATGAEQSVVTDVRRRRCHRVCRRHRGHRHCRWHCHGRRH